MTLFYATPLILTGLAVAIPYHAGLFNIGAEGQLTMGAFFCGILPLLLPGLSPWFAPIAAGIAAFLGGAFWGGIAGYIRAKRNGHEVITTILLNFIAIGATSALTLHQFPNPDSQNPETATIPSQFVIPHFAVFGDAPVTWAFPLSVFLAILFGVFLRKTILGFALRATGQSEDATRKAGLNPATLRIAAMTVGGGIAGLVGVGEVLGNAHRFKIGFSPEYGFTGIAVALVARGNPWGILLSAFFFAALHKGASALEMETEKMNRDLAMIIQGAILLFITIERKRKSR